MRLFAVVACTSLFVLPLVACSSSGDDAASGNQDLTARPHPGLVRVSITSAVGVRIDDAPAPAARQSELVGHDADKQAFWTERAKLQLRHALMRQYFRGSYYPNGLGDDPATNKNPDNLLHPSKGQLPLPPEVDENGNDLWSANISLTGPAKVTTRDGLTFVVRDYRYEGYLLTDEDSPGATEPALAAIGGTWSEPHVLPLDPENILQRTGYACLSEAEFPPNSVDSENAWRFFDHTCKADLVSGCHISPEHPELGGRPLPTETCEQALTSHMGLERTTIRFDRLDPAANGEDLLKKIRVGDPSGKPGADLGVRKDSLNQNRILWRYIGSSSCEMKEENNCVGGAGWRRVLEFDAVGHNVGTKPIHIGPVNYLVNASTTTQNDAHGIFQYSACHHHFHFSHYGTFMLNGGTTTNRKNGFCLESTTRLSNNEWSPLETQYGRCTIQGVEVGWGDEYEAGITCQWIDITDVGAGKIDLGFHSNPDKFLCEGSLEDARGKPTFSPVDKRGNPTPVSVVDEATGWENAIGPDGKPLMFTPKTLDGAVAGPPKNVEIPKCKAAEGVFANNEASVPVDVNAHAGLVASACKRDGQVGAYRDCGWQHETPATPTAAHECTPSSAVHVQCTTGASAPQVVRFCEASRDPKIGGSMDCMYMDALRQNPLLPNVSPAASVVVAPGQTVDLTFACPAAREGIETGGSYSIYTGAYVAGGSAEGVTCAVK
jgi:hypothetical protein